MHNAPRTSVKQPVEFNGLAQIGGHRGLDFLNTVKYRGKADPKDRLNAFADIIVWAQLSNLLTDDEASALAKDTKGGVRAYDEICKFREHARILFEPLEGASNQQSAQYIKAAKYVETAIAALRPTPKINPHSGVLTQRIQVKTPRDLKARIVWEVADLLSERGALSIKTCDGHDCDWVFIDRTKAKRRRWCDTRTCGNTARVRRHRLKQ